MKQIRIHQMIIKTNLKSITEYENIEYNRIESKIE